MTKADFKKWTKNGNLTMSEERILQVSNDIAEGMPGNYTKKEAAEVAVYWSLSHAALHARFQSLLTDVLFSAIELRKRHAISES